MRHSHLFVDQRKVDHYSLLGLGMDLVHQDFSFLSLKTFKKSTAHFIFEKWNCTMKFETKNIHHDLGSGLGQEPTNKLRMCRMRNFVCFAVS